MKAEQQSFVNNVKPFSVDTNIKKKQNKNTKAQADKLNQLLLSMNSISVSYKGKPDEVSQRAYHSEGRWYVYLNIHCCRTQIENIKVTEKFDF
ncbi:MAG: hypothetical protein KAS30_01680 [Candidatus Diapherotrites archaeon]|nr:hypothetical protein [Candidatus Diapherotrites archaeon]